MITKTFGPAEVCRVIGVPRATLHSWLARRYIPVESSGTGTERQFSFEQVVWLTIIADMSCNHIASGTAADLVGQVREELGEALRRNYTRGLVIFISGVNARLTDEPEISLVAKERISAVVRLDLVVRHVRRLLKDAAPTRKRGRPETRPSIQ